MKQFLLLLLCFGPAAAFSQFGLSIHQSNLPFVGFNYEIIDRIKPELRVGIDNFFEDFSLEGAVTCDIIDKATYEVYGGLGYRFRGFNGLTIPLGAIFYPLPNRNFGFHIELAPVFGDLDLLRGSWGIRYKFRKLQ